MGQGTTGQIRRAGEYKSAWGAWRCHLLKETTERRCSKIRARVLQNLLLVRNSPNRKNVHCVPLLPHGPVDNHNYVASQEVNDRPALPQHLHTRDDAQNNQGPAPLAKVGEPSTSFATSFTSSFSTHPRSKRPRTSQSSPLRVLGNPRNKSPYPHHRRSNDNDIVH